MSPPHVKRTFLLLGSIIFVVVPLAYFSARPRTLTVSEVPIAFWAWRTEAPNELEVQSVFSATGARTLFLRSGQFDSADRNVERIRAASGKVPSVAELHLVYNATR